MASVDAQVAAIGVEPRAAFIARTYNHLLGAIAAFTLLEIAYFQTGLAAPIANALLSVNWLVVLGGFVLISWIASRFAHTAESIGVQYAALSAYVFAQSLIFVPLLYIADYYAPGSIQSAATLTLMGFAGLTGIAFWTRREFSFMRALLPWAGMVAMLAIVGSVTFGLQLGTWFSIAMIGLAGVAILHDTSKVIHSFPEDRYVGAALELFASVALMFWYVLSLVSRD
jgi:hypothetical protein